MNCRGECSGCGECHSYESKNNYNAQPYEAKQENYLQVNLGEYN